TEEGCYRLEESYADFERNSSACLHHASVQSAFCDFVTTHTRRGKIKNNIAVIHGKYDSFSLFNRNTIWGMEGSEWRDSEKSWDMLHVFFPKAELDVVYRHDCPHEPTGFFTGTPYGLIDIIPDDADGSFIARYPYVIMLGYNAADEDFVSRMLAYVEGGGTLLATLAHFTYELNHEKANSGMAKVCDCKALRELCGCAEIADTAEGQRIVTENGRPRIIDRRVGKGRLILFNTAVYPDHESVREDYTAAITRIAEKNAEAEREHGWLDADGWVSTSVYDAEDRRTIYALNVNWWSDGEPEEKVTLHNAGYSYDLTVLRDCVNIVSVFGDTAFVTADMGTDIISYDGILRVQGREGDTVTVCRFGKTVQLKLSCDGVSEIAVENANRMCG
ncbi:MAG: hypothetical protein K2L51_01930, partial [Clostridiales bacterium]|nr:hypothetical protein [Clostridiales bacterium]